MKIDKITFVLNKPIEVLEGRNQYETALLVVNAFMAKEMVDVEVMKIEPETVDKVKIGNENVVGAYKAAEIEMLVHIK